MAAGKVTARLFLLAIVAAISVSPLAAQHRPLARTFQAGEERYSLTISLKAQTQSVAIETVASKSYVLPVLHSAEVRLKHRTLRRILSVKSDASAEIEEIADPGHCEEIHQPNENADAKLQTSLSALCAALAAPIATHYTEESNGSLHDSATANLAQNLGEDAPPLLALWFHRAVRPGVVFPALPFEAGAKTTHELQSPNELLRDARGSESTEWLESQAGLPSVALHVVQQLAWDPSAHSARASNTRSYEETPARHETFFADSITTLSLFDGSVVRANRSASRTTSHTMNPVAGLSKPPEFSSKLSISVTIERLP